MARYYDQRFFGLVIILFAILWKQAIIEVVAKRANDTLTACQHLRRAETRRAKTLSNTSAKVRVPRCTKFGNFEPIQCINFTNGTDCWCVDEYGMELPGTRREKKENVNCVEPSNCSASSCRMFCPSGFARDIDTGCSICKCRDSCDGIDCPGGQSCQLQEVKCKTEPCPPIPTCKKARSLLNWCPAGQPLSISDSIRPFLCGTDPGKPTCPPLYECLVESMNDYGVCCPNSLKYRKPGICPNDQTGDQDTTCGTPCSHDLECNNLEKCCYSKSCQFNCKNPYNVTICHQTRALSEIIAVNEREGRGYIPHCNGPGGTFSPKQCSRNGIVCWCVDPKTGHKIKGTMGPANMVNCDEVDNLISRSLGRSVNMQECDTNICAAVCEYGFKNDHHGCPSCECSDPCEGFVCTLGSHCEVATDPQCASGSTLCASVPVCKPDLIYSNPCDIGTPLADNITGEAIYCREEDRRSREYQLISFFDDEVKEGRALTSFINCPEDHVCTKLHKQSSRVCCPLPQKEEPVAKESRQQSMCEYLRDFSDRMEGTEDGMELAIKPPKCTSDGSYEARQCTTKQAKISENQKRQILEQNMVRQMKKIFHFRRKRDSYTSANLRLYRVDENVSTEKTILSSRAAKIIDVNSLTQLNIDLNEKNLKKNLQVTKKDIMKENLAEVEIEECWCVDGFGTEIPDSRSENITLEKCLILRESLECLDLTCRMGCEYGFVLDPGTKCPACNCRDPCDGIVCEENKECRTVEVSCDEEYCPPVPACLPRKAGQCPYLVPPGPDNLDADTCAYECRSDVHCEGTKRCCSNGCGTQCVEPQMKTACQHLKAIQMHQASELGIPARQTYIAQCDDESGKFTQVQCGINNTCWCIDDYGQEISGTRVKGKTPSCIANSAFNCPSLKCSPCGEGYKVDNDGCRTCVCRNFCDEISCSGDEECHLVDVECIGEPCPKMPVCVPRRETICPEGSPLQINGKEILCGPQNKDDTCPTTHTCQLSPMTQTGVCCTKTRDVCFESIDGSCLRKNTTEKTKTRWMFSPAHNKCVQIEIAIGEVGCTNKNLFHNELACNSVCPVLTQCERLKLKNNLAAKRTGPSSVWFHPRCDPVTGHWSPVQCLGKQPLYIESKQLNTNEGLTDVSGKNPTEGSVCWCADKKGAPLKGTLTRDVEPVCTHRQARKRSGLGIKNSNDFLMEELIRQMTTMINDETSSMLNDLEFADRSSNTYTATESIIKLANSIIETKSKPVIPSMQRLVKTITRCQFMSKTAHFPVICDENGAFIPTQCNGDQCWCVDEAGNQLPETTIFKVNTKNCFDSPVDSVTIQLVLINTLTAKMKDIYDILKKDLFNLLGETPENLRVQENADGTVHLSFELHSDDKVDTAFAIEQMIKEKHVLFGNGILTPDITLSRFVHRHRNLPMPEAALHIADNTFQTVIFVLATASAFLVSIFVVFVMLKRGKKKVIGNIADNRSLGTGDKYIDFSSPIFVLNTNEKIDVNNKTESSVNINKETT